MKVKIYGCRASVAVSRPSRYGSNTTCVRIDTDGQTLIIDAGSGLLRLEDELRATPGFPKRLPFQLDILLSHLHLDHIIGLGTFDNAWDKTRGVRFYTCSRDARPLVQQVCGVFAPPYWPASMVQRGAVEAIEIKHNETFTIGCFTVTPFIAFHPDKTMSFHITDGQKHFVHILDCETPKMCPEEREMLNKYCTQADMVVFDASYSDEDYLDGRIGWGHSTARHGVELAKEWQCKKMVFAHFDQRYSDEELDSWARIFPHDGFVLAQDGMELPV